MRGDILGLERRRRWGDEEKLEIVLSVGVGGATVTQVAQRHDVTRQQIYAWRHELAGHWCSRLSCLRRDGHEERHRGVGRSCAGSSAPEADRWGSVRVPWPPRRQAEAALLGRARLLPLLQGAAKGPLSLARARGRRGAADLGATGNAVGGGRL